MLAYVPFMDKLNAVKWCMLVTRALLSFQTLLASGARCVFVQAFSQNIHGQLMQLSVIERLPGHVEHELGVTRNVNKQSLLDSPAEKPKT